jgi:hypothetical protein
MLARSGRLPAGDYSFEVKWDGFGAIVSTEGSLRVRSRRGWDMTERVSLLAQIPVRAVLDGELVALDGDGRSRRRAWWRPAGGETAASFGPERVGAGLSCLASRIRLMVLGETRKPSFSNSPAIRG